MLTKLQRGPRVTYKEARAKADADMSGTTRRYPRSLADAFPDERAQAFEAPAPSGCCLTWWLAILLVSALGAIVIMFGRPV